MQKTGTPPKSTPQQQPSKGEAATTVARPAPPPGMGKLVDKTA
ncbi:MAG: hypothetical protein WA750_14520 [Pseudolabrys sp.]